MYETAIYMYKYLHLGPRYLVDGIYYLDQFQIRGTYMAHTLLMYALCICNKEHIRYSSNLYFMKFIVVLQHIYEYVCTGCRLCF